MSSYIECEQCQHRIKYDDSAPKFCSECGCSLTGSFAQSQAEETLARSVETPVDREEATLPPDQTGPVTKAHVEKFKLESVGPYRLVKKLGQGGMGTVFEAQHTESGRNVALKLLSPDVRGTDEMVQRFRRESQIAASINHPRSTFVYESGEHDGQLYITMELMDGGTLKDVVAAEGPLPVGRAVDYVLDIIDGLLVAHNAGIVHRDLKPSNSFVDRDGRIKVGDFGLAKSFLGDSSLTQTGTFMGTPQYAAPEQIRNADVDERTDIYALGGTLFYLLTGRAPFVGNPAQVISSIASDIPPKLSEIAKGIPKPLVRLVAQTLEKDPERRPFNLNMVRDGLLPFSTRGSMAADPGRRMGAFFFDNLTLAIIGSFLIGIVSPLLLFLFESMNVSLNPQLIGISIYVMFMVSFFAICESQWGRTPGKWLFGLRVVDASSESPSIMMALLRALIVPGLAIIVDQSVSMFYLSNSDMADAVEIMAVSFKAQGTGRVLVWATLLGIISTARKENGYRAVHDWLTRTKVVRLSGNLESRLLDQAAIVVPVAITRRAVGNHEVVGQFQEPKSGHKSLLGRDNQLERPLWLFTGFADSPFDETRRHLTRPSRLRIINQSCDDDGHWYSTESVPGVPLIEVIRGSACSWKSACPLFRDIAYELANSEESDLIPKQLTIGHFWLDHTGRIRVLDHLLVGSGQYQPPSETSDAKTNAIDVCVQLFQEYMDHQDHPVELMQLSQSLKERGNEKGVFDWLVGELNETIEKQSSWNWIDRAGMLAISFGIEFSFMSSLVFIGSFLLSGLPLLPQTALTATIGFLIVGGYGFFADGGPAMRLTNVSLRNQRDKKPAARWLATLRSLIAWSPWVALMTGLMYLIYFNFASNDGKPVDLDSIDPAVVIGLLAGFSFVSLVAFGGMLLAVLNPSRGIPDFLLGTRLMRK